MRGWCSRHLDALNLTSNPSQVSIHNIVRPIPYAFLAANWITTLDPMVHRERDVRSLLRPSEHLLLILEGFFLRHGLKSDSEASSPTLVGDTSLESSSEETRVILAIIVHVDHAVGESGRLIINTFAPPSCAEHLPKCVPLYRGRLDIRGLPWLPSCSPTYIRNSRGIFA